MIKQAAEVALEAAAPAGSSEMERGEAAAELAFVLLRKAWQIAMGFKERRSFGSFIELSQTIAARATSFADVARTPADRGDRA